MSQVERATNPEREYNPVTYITEAALRTAQKIGVLAIEQDNESLANILEELEIEPPDASILLCDAWDKDRYAPSGAIYQLKSAQPLGELATALVDGRSLRYQSQKHMPIVFPDWSDEQKIRHFTASALDFGPIKTEQTPGQWLKEAFNPRNVLSAPMEAIGLGPKQRKYAAIAKNENIGVPFKARFAP